MNLRAYLDYILESVQGSRRWLVYAVIATPAIVAVTMAVPILVERFLKNYATLDTLLRFGFAAALAVALLARGTLEIVIRYFLTALHVDVLARIRGQAFLGLQREAIALQSNHRSGELGNLLSFDSRLAAMGAIQLYQMVVLYPPQIIALMAVILYYDYRFLLVALVVFPVSLSGAALLSRRARRAENRYLAEEAHWMGAAVEALANARQVKAMGIPVERQKHLQNLDRSVMYWRQRSAVFQSIPGPVSEVVVGLAVVALILIAGHFPSITGDLTAISACAAALMMMRTPVRGFASVFIASQGSRVSVERLLWAIARAPDGDERTEHDFGNRVDRVRLKGIHFSYNGQRPILGDVNASFERGALHLICGPSGSGKTTLLDIIAGFYPPMRGQLEIDEHVLDVYTLEGWRRCVGLVSQETLLFDETIRANITMGLEGAAEEDLVTACEQAGMQEMIDTLSDGLETRIGERGRLLSGGERRRVSLARTLIRKPAVLLLDEITAEMDPDNEAHILGTLKRLAADYLVIHVSHRASAREFADRTWEMKAGQLLPN